MQAVSRTILRRPIDAVHFESSNSRKFEPQCLVQISQSGIEIRNRPVERQIGEFTGSICARWNAERSSQLPMPVASVPTEGARDDWIAKIGDGIACRHSERAPK